MATDLDRTLIYSRRFLSEVSTPTLCVERYNGQPASFMTPTAAEATRRLAATGLLVPATTRTIVQFQRIDLPGGPCRYAVTSNGGNILVDGEPDAGWRASVTAAIRRGGAALETILDDLRHRIDEQWVHSLRVAEDLFCYLVVDAAAMPAQFTSGWARWCEPRGWKVSQQGRKVYTVPHSLCKSSAVEEIRRRLVDSHHLDADAVVVAAGDGALDADMLIRADAAIRPAHGELHALGWYCDNLTVTDAVGASAAEEILRWFEDQSRQGAVTRRAD